ncbi:MAG: S8 family serine peptidase [Bacteroidales bacterium]|nr:S8 family serine peptidase [Candidatus Colimorpha onthohippi]
MKFLFPFVLFCGVAFAATAQSPAVADNQTDTGYFYWVRFSDKDSTPGRLDKPQQFLSQRAIERRRRLQIAIDSFDLPVVPSYLDSVRACGARLHNVSKWLNGVTVVADSAIAADIAQLSFVTQVARYNRRRLPVALGGTPDTATKKYGAGTDYSIQPCASHDSSYYNLGYSQIAQLGGIALHRRGYEGQGVWVGVCDGGFPGVDTLSAFKSMRDEGRIVATRDFACHRPTVYTADAHGTMVLSNVGAYLPSVYVATAPKATYVLCITEDATESPIEELNWVSAAEYLDSLGIDVINTSLGYRGFDDTTLRHPFSDLDGKTAWMSIGADIAASRGILCVNSAGNEGREGSGSLSVPADAEHILSVGAAWSNGDRAAFSSWGQTADGRVKPDVMAQGVLVYVSMPGGGYAYANGTSMASPITAGMVACLRQAAPNASVQQIFDAIRASGSNAMHVDNRIGYGVPDYKKALQLLLSPRFPHRQQ